MTTQNPTNSGNTTMADIMSKTIIAQIDAQNVVTEKFFEYLDQFTQTGNPDAYKTYSITNGTTITKIKIPYLAIANVPNFQLKTVETELSIQERSTGSSLTNAKNPDYKMKFVSEKPEMSSGLAKLVSEMSKLIEVTTSAQENTL